MPCRMVLAAVLLLSVGLPCWAAETENGALPARILGIVVDDEGRTLAGAKLSLFRDVYTVTPRIWEPVGEPVTSDEKGKYAFENVPEGWYAVMAEREGMAKAFRYVIVEPGSVNSIEMRMAPAVVGAIEVRDGDGQPLPEATLRALAVTSENGEFGITNPSQWKSLGYEFPKSDFNGRLQLPPLPEGSRFSATIHHPKWAPARIDKQETVASPPARVTLERGTELRIKLEPKEGADLPKEVVVTLVHEPVDDPASILMYPIGLTADGELRLTIAPGKYRHLWLDHEDYVITPRYSWDPFKTFLEFPLAGVVAPYEFQVFSKQIVRGRVIDETTGKPIAGANLAARTAIHEFRGKLAPERQRFTSDWEHIGWSQTDKDGQYAIKLAPGLARLELSHEGYDTGKNSIEFEVSATEITPGPEIRAYPMHKIDGQVVDASGEPVPNALVRVRGDLFHMPPVEADEQGCFEITPKWIPIDANTQERIPVQPVVAFHPFQPLMAKVNVDLSDAESVQGITLTLEPEPANALFEQFCSEMSSWERDEWAKETRDERMANTLVGKSAPPLEGTWLNAPDGTTSLDDFRGKYVLLDFWFIGCGPCHADVPSLKMLQELYHDHGVTIIAVHNNSQAADAVKAYIAKEKYPYPVLVDHPDGRTVSRYEEHGLTGYPAYFLIGPDGKVIQDDKTTPAPSLRSYKIEILRQYVLQLGQEASKNRDAGEGEP